MTFPEQASLGNCADKLESTCQRVEEPAFDVAAGAWAAQLEGGELLHGGRWLVMIAGGRGCCCTVQQEGGPLLCGPRGPWRIISLFWLSKH